MALPGGGVRRRHNSLEEEEGGIDGLPQPPSHSSDTWAWRRHAARALLVLACGVAVTITTLYHDGVSTADTAAITTPRSPSETAGNGPFWGRIRRRDMKGVVPRQQHVQYQAQGLHAPEIDPNRRRHTHVKQQRGDEDRRLDGDGYGLPGYEELTDPSWWVGWLPYKPFSTTAAPAPTASPTSSPTHHPTPAPTTRAELMLDYAAYVHEHGVTKRGNEYPACAMQRSMDEEGVLCSAGSAWVELTKVLPPQLGKGSVARPPKNPQGRLPERLQDLRPLPSTIPQHVHEQERPTYYWLYRCILNFYGVMRLLENATYVDGLALPPEWGRMKMYRIDRGRAAPAVEAEEAQAHDFSWRAPLVMSFFREKDATALVVVRGTIYDREWQRDFEYDFMPRNISSLFFPADANVHAGFFKVFYKLVDPLIHKEVLRLNPRRVIVTGHSLGGSVGELLAYYTALSQPHAQVDLVSFGSPNVGDAHYARGFNARVNNRHLTFTGVGEFGDESYHIGDWISQVPCGHLGACVLLDAVKQAERLSYRRHYANNSHHQQGGGGHGISDDGEVEEEEDLAMEEWLDQQPSTASVFTEPFSTSSSSANATTEPSNPSYNYTAVGGAVPFTAQDLGHNWVARADLRSYRYSPVGAHVCSYLCWLAPVVGDPEDRCTFAYDWGGRDVPAQYRCPHSM